MNMHWNKEADCAGQKQAYAHLQLVIKVAQTHKFRGGTYMYTTQTKRYSKMM